MITNAQEFGALLWAFIFVVMLILYILTWIFTKKRPHILGSDEEQHIAELSKRVKQLEEERLSTNTTTGKGNAKDELQ